MPTRWSTLRAFVSNNRGMKSLSLLLAVITWYAINETISFETVVADVPLVIQVDPEWAVLERSTDTVDVHFRGSQEDLLRLNRDYVEVAVDVRGKPIEGSLAVPLNTDNVRAPGGARPAYVHPNTLTLSLDRKGEKQVPVKLDIQGKPSEGYGVEKVTCTPASVRLIGPRQRLEEIDVVRTAPIDLEGRAQSFRLRISVVPPSETWVALIEPQKVLAEVSIVERSARRVVEDVGVKVLVESGRDVGATIQPSRIAVVLQGRRELLDQLVPGDVDAYIDCSNLEPAVRYELPVRIHAPAGISVGRTEPATVTVVMGRR